MTQPPPILEARRIGKRFGGVTALDGVSVSIEAGHVHAFVGENGAGKSTFGKIVAGGVRPDSGELLLDGTPISFGSPHDALSSGVAMILQEISLVPERSVLENVFLGQEPTRLGAIRSGALRERFDALAERLSLELDPHVRVADLRLADQQKVELMRAVAREARVLVMDEPTAVMTPAEVRTLAGVIAKLKAEGVAIVYVSHFLKEVLDLADVVTVLRDGRLISTMPAAEHDEDSLMGAMLGRSISRVFPPLPTPQGGSALSVEGLSSGSTLDDVSLDVREGEIVGLAGLVGSGRSELARAIAGIDPVDTGTVAVRGAGARIGSPLDGIRSGIALIPESRKEQGLCLGLSIRANTTLTYLGEVCRYGVLSGGREREEVRRAMERFDIRGAEPGAPVDQLSGGNQQKVLFAKSLLRPPAVLIADEPTRGVDIGAKVAIYEILARLAGEGMGVLLISSEVEELLGLSHRILVMRAGRIVADFGREEADEEAIMREAFGTSERNGAPVG